MQILLFFSASLIAVAWLMPNHYLPWTSAWGDGASILGLLMLMLCLLVSLPSSGGRISWRLPVVAVLCVMSVLGQLAVGKLYYAGDAVMTVMYVGLWLGAVLAGRLLLASPKLKNGFDVVVTAWVLAAIVSVAIALVQWTGTQSLYEFGADLHPGGRPFGNVAQPNHLNTLCFIAICGLLWLFQVGKVGRLVNWASLGVLLFGMIITQSRTGWLQIGLLVGWGLLMRERTALRITRKGLFLIGFAYVAGVMLWPWVCDVSLLSAGRSLDDQMRPGVRLPYWWSMIDAIGRRPFFGYGWLQIGSAQQYVALDHEPMGVLFDHSHNFILDLLLWAGIPLASGIVIVLAWWFADHIRVCKDGRQVWLLAVVGGVLVHGMLEYPLTYAYFLIPVGLTMGAIESFARDERTIINISRPVVLSLSVLLGTLVCLVANDYFNIEERFRNLRFEMQRIGVDKIKPTESNALLLTQLETLMEFYRTEARPGMAPKQLDMMRRLSERYGYPPVLLRYALAAGLNGQPEVAGVTLARLCSIHVSARCEDAKESWSELTVKYPQLSAVKFPDSPWVMPQGLDPVRGAFYGVR